MAKKIKYQYPWRYNNSFQLLVDGDIYFSAMLNGIKSAKSRILLEAYLFESGSIANIFIAELCAAKKRGIEIFILLDEYGSKDLTDKDKNILTSEGVELLLYNPASFLNFGKSLKRDHRKLLAIDERTAFIGGAGITDEFSPEVTNEYWHDVMLKVDGDIVIDLVHSFIGVWNTHKQSLKTDKPLTEKVPPEIKNKSRVVTSTGTDKNEITRTLITRIRASKKRVWLTSPYFISSWKIRRALRYAANKGVDVRLIFPGPYSDHQWVTYGIQRYYQRLLKANVAVYEFQPRFTHTKVILCDDWFTIGSSNFDLWNQFLNLDANIEIYDRQSCLKIIELFESNFSKSTLILLSRWNTRPLLQRIKEWISGLMIKVLRAIGSKFKR